MYRALQYRTFTLGRSKFAAAQRLSFGTSSGKLYPLKCSKISSRTNQGSSAASTRVNWDPRKCGPDGSIWDSSQRSSLVK